MIGPIGQTHGIEAVVDWYAIVFFISVCWFTFLSSSNALFFQFSRRRSRIVNGPPLSVLIPARNEENRIRPTLEALSKQIYEHYEVIVIDDNSTDETWNVLQEYVTKYQHFSAIKGEPLPEGWNGKPYAMYQLAKRASGEVFVFLDADITAEPDFLSWVADRIKYHSADSLSAYARHRGRSFLENIFFSIIYMINMTILPFWLIKFTHSLLFSHAIGQIMVFRREVYESSGGYEKVRDKISEDIHMARVIKTAGYRHVFLDARKVLSGYMYDSLSHTFDGLKRVIYEYFDKKLYPIIILSVFLMLFLIFPPAILLAAHLLHWANAQLILYGNIGLLFAWSLCLFDRRQPWYVPLFFPVQFAFVIIMAWKSFYDDVVGPGFNWKGRTVR